MVILSEDMKMGVAHIDAQHQELIDRLNVITSMGIGSVSKEETEKTLDLLADYTIRHFADEEKLQEQCGYPLFDWHKEQHKLFLEEFANLKQEFSANGPSMMFSFILNKSIIDWVFWHIKHADVEFGKFYKKHMP